MEQFLHGGDIYNNQVRMDFSVNTNLFGMPEGVREVLAESLADAEHYPDASCAGLRSALEDKYGVPAENILCGNGASELLFAIARAVSPKRSLVPVPAFSEYERALLAAGSDIVFLKLSEEDGFKPDQGILDFITEDTQLLFLCSPSNPVGNVMEPALLQKILQKCRETGCYAAVDECFLEFLPGYEAYSAVRYLEENDRLIVIRAFTKLYAMAGIRLGYCMTGNKALSDKIRQQLPCWNVSVFAQRAGKKALDEAEYLEASVKAVSLEREFMVRELKSMGFHVLPSHANFICFQSSTPLYAPLLLQGLLIRSCNDYRGMENKGYYRIAVKRREENRLLLQAVRRILENQRSGSGTD